MRRRGNLAFVKFLETLPERFYGNSFPHTGEKDIPGGKIFSDSGKSLTFHH